MYKQKIEEISNRIKEITKVIRGQNCVETTYNKAKQLNLLDKWEEEGIDPEEYILISFDDIVLLMYDSITLGKENFKLISNNRKSQKLPYELLDMTEKEIIEWACNKEIKFLEKRRKNIDKQ